MPARLHSTGAFVLQTEECPTRLAVGIAYGSAELFGVSFALGAFFAGMVMRESALISIALNPLLFRLIEPAQAWIRSRSELARLLERSDDPLAELPPTVDQSLLSGHVVPGGYGHVGRRIGEALVSRGVPIVVAEQNREIVERLRDQELAAGGGRPACYRAGPSVPSASLAQPRRTR